MRNLGLHEGTLAGSIGELLQHVTSLLVCLGTLICFTIHLLLENGHTLGTLCTGRLLHRRESI